MENKKRPEIMTGFITAILATVLVLPPFASCKKHIDEDRTEPAPRKDIVLTKAQQGYVDAGNAFAFDSYRAICGVPASGTADGADGTDDTGASSASDIPAESRIYSPLSVTYALGMLTNGAAGETKSQLTGTLGFGEDLDALNEFCHLLMSESAAVDPSTTIDIANAVIANNMKLKLNDRFTGAVEKFYDAEVSNMNFATDNVAAFINGWCNTKTKGMIPKIIDEVDPSYLCCLLNAIYFKGAWQDKFETSMTRKENFTHEDGSIGKMEMMHQTERFAVGSNEVYETICLPYGNGAYRMYVLLPVDGHSVDEIVAGLTPESWKATLGNLRGQKVDLKLPKFETEYTIPLNNVLKSLGIKDAFNPEAADFSAMCEQASCIDKVLQKAKIKVNEEGTEAAAVTVIGMVTTSYNPSQQIYYFHADHPFLYLITEVSTGAIFFMGQQM